MDTRTGLQSITSPEGQVRSAGIETFHLSQVPKGSQAVVVSCDCGARVGGRMWMNTAALREDLSGGESAGKEAGVLRVDDSNNRGSSRDGHPRSHQGHPPASARPLLRLYQKRVSDT